MRSFSLFRSSLYHLSFFVHSRPYPPCCIACHHFHTGHPTQYWIPLPSPSPYHRITSTFLGDFSFASATLLLEIIFLWHVSASPFLLTTYSRSSPFIIAQAGVEASLPSRSFPSIFPLYIYSLVCWRPSSQNFADFLHVARCSSYRETPLRALVITSRVQ